MFQRIVLLIVLTMTLHPASAFAQTTYATDKGSVMIGGTFSFLSQGYEDLDTRYTVYELMPSALYFILPDLGVGGTFVWRHASSWDDDITIVGFGPKIAHYFGNPNKATVPFVAASLSYLRETNVYTETDIRFSGGFVHLLSSHVGITGEGYYEWQSIKFERTIGSYSGNQAGLLFGISAFLY
jgi:hypothetical protein